MPSNFLGFLGFCVEFGEGAPRVHGEDGLFLGDVTASERTNLGVHGGAHLVGDGLRVAQEVRGCRGAGREEMREQSGEVLFERCEPIEDAKAMGGGEGVALGAWV